MPTRQNLEMVLQSLEENPDQKKFQWCKEQTPVLVTLNEISARVYSDFLMRFCTVKDQLQGE